MPESFNDGLEHQKLKNKGERVPSPLLPRICHSYTNCILLGSCFGIGIFRCIGPQGAGVCSRRRGRNGNPHCTADPRLADASLSNYPHSKTRARFSASMECKCRTSPVVAPRWDWLTLHLYEPQWGSRGYTRRGLGNLPMI